MAVLRTIFWWSFFWVSMFATVIFFIPIALFKIISAKNINRKFINFLASTWSKTLIWLTGSKVMIKGKENIPNDGAYCVVSNHQGNFDIPLILSVLPSTVGFIAKKELKALPIFGWWMQIIGVLFIDRTDRRQSLRIIEEGARKIAGGHPMVIFPEGTRGKNGIIAPFKKGSLKLALKSKAKILPISIDGTHKVLESNGGLVKPSHIKITIHTPVDLSNLSSDEIDNMAKKLQSIISVNVEGN